MTVSAADTAAGVPAAAPATNQHYDLDPEIFARFLDPLRKYSSGLFRTDADTLELAQRQKLSFVAEQLGLTGGERLLDVGCGWGALLLFMAEEYRCRTVGISPAPRQHAYIRGRVAERRLDGLVRTETASFETYEPEAGAFDAVTLLGSVVHMDGLDTVFAKIRRALRRGGTLYLSESCFRSEAVRRTFDQRPGTDFIRNSVFGSGDLRPLSELIAAAEGAGFSLRAVHDLTTDYHRTIELWSENVRAAAGELDDLDAGLTEQLLRYLEIANAGWGYTTKHYALVCRKSR
ncbi:class I SAM-dependent methyltransferase [Streptomyces sp. NPDC048637]|uniref:SAM-dependent methyltransferase n=1 Tax=Streptomyces sp. NPDC048637 TaxID=3155636 RepID=UPI0034342888